MRRHDLRDLDHLVRMFRSAALEPPDESPRAFAHRSRGELLHALELGRRRRREVVAFDDVADLVVRHLRDDVHRDALLAERLPVAREVGPGALRLRQPVARRHRRSLAEHVERDALTHLALGVAVVEERLIRVRVEIDEAGSDDEAGRVNRARRRAGHATDGGDLAVLHGDVAQNQGLPVPSTIRPPRMTRS